MSACHHQAAAVGGGQQETPGASTAVFMLSLFDNALGRVLRRAVLAAVIMLCHQCLPTCKVGGSLGVRSSKYRSASLLRGISDWCLENASPYDHAASPLLSKIAAVWRFLSG